MKTKIEIKSIFGELLFSYEKEENTLKHTLEEAIKVGAILRYADLRYADLRNANLRDADLRNADLRNADLCDANLCNADLRYANLCYANLCYANLCYANLRDADLCDANLCYANLCYANLGDWGSLKSCTDVLCVAPIGSRNGCTIFFHTNKGIFVKCGCFRGTIEEFADKVKETHGNNEHARDYSALIEFVKVKFNVV